MGIVDNALIGASGNQGYNLQRSLRFRSAATADLERTPSTTGTGGSKTWTYSIWIKRGLLATRQSLVDGYAASAGHVLEFQSTDNLEFYAWGGAAALDLVTTQVFRDPSAWYHIVLAVDTTQATAANRIKLYVNGAQVTSFSTATYPAQNALTYIGSNVLQDIGRRGSNQFYSDCYFAEINFVDGQALTPSSFGSTNTLTGVWQPARYGGTYGTNGFYLPFTDNSALTTSSNVGLGKDFSGNGNYFTTNNISITAGTTYDSMTDVPTLTSATAANYCVGNPLSVGSNTSLTNANLSGTLTGSGGWSATICGLTSGKWYWEATPTANSGNSMWVGFLSDVYTKNDNAWSYSTQTALYANDARNGNNASYGATWTTGDVIGVALDLSTSNGSVTFYKNGVSQGVMFSSLTSSARWRPLISGGGTGTTIAMNFGQRPFTYTPPTGYVALNTYNLPTSTIVKGNTVMDATLWTGNGTSQSITNAGAFKPDFVWIKNRNNVRWHILTDSVRGTNSQLFSNDTLAQETRTDRLTAFNSNGFSVGSYTDVNLNADTFVGWQWQAGQGTTSTNTNGTITSTVSVNATAGFSVVSYTGTGSNANVGHGLGVAPQFIITKNRSAVSAWHCYAAAIPNMQNGYIVLNSTAAFSTSTNTVWNGIQPTSSVFSVGTDAGPNGSGNAIIAYCWTPIAGYSAFGSLTTNGSADNTFVYTGFKPRWIMWKRTDGANAWGIVDTARSTYNVTGPYLLANASDAEGTATLVDILSNGFKFRDSGFGAGQTYIYIAFAENPFKNSLAR